MIVNDKMQKGYEYFLSESIGENFDKNFKPEFTPMEMLRLGVFEGQYMNDCQDEFPIDWFENARISFNGPDIKCNCFGVKSRLSLSVWRQKGWIVGPDPRGWFQWYCRYYMGRRIENIDDIQIKRWIAFKRHKKQVEYNCKMLEMDCRIKQRQALLQWAYNPFF